MAIILGLGVMAGAVMLRRGVTGNGVGAQFLRQLALVGCFCGQMLFIGGTGATTESTEAAAIAALIASAILIAVYPDRVQRFCSTVIAAGALLALIREMPYCADVMALLMAGSALAWTHCVERRDGRSRGDRRAGDVWPGDRAVRAADREHGGPDVRGPGSRHEGSARGADRQAHRVRLRAGVAVADSVDLQRTWRAADGAGSDAGVRGDHRDRVDRRSRRRPSPRPC